MLKGLFGALFAAVLTTSPATASQWIEGGLYVTAQEDGTFVPLKVLKLDDVGVHIRLYSNVYSDAPSHIDESSLYMAGIDSGDAEPLGVGHMPVSNEHFMDWNPKFVQQSSVTADELEGYKVWLEAQGGYF